uniref:(northern house mosquito) hypothetical protein n=1 Tax=Culex pipiens TaxID=7175 RepID=A0A8D8G527_CULPI
MDASEFQVPQVEIKDEPQSDEEAFEAMEFVEIDGIPLVDRIKTECTREAEESFKNVILNLETKLKEIAQNNAEEGFLFQISEREYVAISVRKIFFMARLTKLVQGYCSKSLRLYKVCNGCDFKAIQEKDMEKHFEGCPSGSYHHALGTFFAVAKYLQCGTCCYRSSVRYNILRHQKKLGHVGIKKVVEGSSTVEESLEINSQEIIESLQTKLEHEAKKGRKDFLLRISKEELAAICETKFSIITKLSNAVRSHCDKDVKHYQVCDGCAFKASRADDMKQHFESRSCSTFYDAIGTCPKRNRRAALLRCNNCDFKTDQSGNMRRHLVMRGHDGFEKSKRPPKIPKRKPAPVHIVPCPHCGLQMPSSTKNRHIQMYCKVLHKKAIKLGTDYDVPVDELGTMNCEDCGKVFNQYYYMKRHIANGCPVLRKRKMEENARGKRKYQRRPREVGKATEIEAEPEERC